MHHCHESNQTRSLHPNLGRISRCQANAVVARNGFFLGASLDFWLVAATCVAGLLLCFLCSVAAVELQTWRWRWGKEVRRRNTVGTLLTEPLLRRPPQHLGFLHRVIFKAQRFGESFAFFSDLALRGALVASFCAASYRVPALSWWQQQGWEMSYVVVIVAFSFYTDLGTSNFLAWTGFYGTLLPVANCWLMFSIFPYGTAAGDWTAKVFGYANFLIVVLLTFVLNFATNAKMYTLSWQAYFTMCFLNPFDDTTFSCGVRDVQLHSAETGALMGTVVGCLLAVLAALLPSCISALSRAQKMILEVVWCHGRLLEQLLNHGGTHMQEHTAVVFAEEVRGLHEQLGEIKNLLNSSWWECFDLGCAGRSRQLMSHLCDCLEVLNDWLEAMVMAVQQKCPPGCGRTFHHIKEGLSDLTLAADVALYHCAALAVRGASQDGCWKSLQGSLLDLQEAERSLTQTFAERGLREVEKSPMEGFSKTELPQLALASSISGYSQKVSNHLASFQGSVGVRRVGPCCGFWKGFVDLFPANPFKLQSWKAVTYSNAKLFATFLVCFILGRLGLGSGLNAKPLIPNWNATPAGTVAYLIFQGGNKAAALKKNLDRFIGVGLGTMLGQLTMGISCDISMDVGAELACGFFLLAYFCLEFLSFFVYFASPNFFYAGLMFSCFFAEHSLHQCDKRIGTRSLSNYQNLLSQLVAIIVASLMDLLTDKSMSIRATDSLEKFVTAMQRALDAFPLGQRDELFQLRLEGLELLASARCEGREAASEPRLMGVPWREELWQHLMYTCNESWQSLTVLSATAKPSTPDESNLRRAVDVLLGAPSFLRELQRLSSRSMEAFNVTVGLMRQSYYDDACPSTVALQKQLMIASRLHDLAVPQILEEVRERLLQRDTLQPPGYLLEDRLCAVAMFLLMFEALAERVRLLEQAVLKQPEMWQLLGERLIPREVSLEALES